MGLLETISIVGMILSKSYKDQLRSTYYVCTAALSMKSLECCSTWIPCAFFLLKKQSRPFCCYKSNKRSYGAVKT